MLKYSFLITTYLANNKEGSVGCCFLFSHSPGPSNMFHPVPIDRRGHIQGGGERGGAAVDYPTTFIMNAHTVWFHQGDWSRNNYHLPTKLSPPTKPIDNPREWERSATPIFSSERYQRNHNFNATPVYYGYDSWWPKIKKYSSLTIACPRIG